MSVEYMKCYRKSRATTAESHANTENRASRHAPLRNGDEQAMRWGHKLYHVIRNRHHFRRVLGDGLGCKRTDKKSISRWHFGMRLIDKTRV